MIKQIKVILHDETTLEIISGLLTILLLAIIAYFGKDIGHKTITKERAIMYMSTIVCLHLLLMHWKAAHTLVSDIVCLVITGIVGLFGMVFTLILCLWVIKDWMITTIDYEIVRYLGISFAMTLYYFVLSPRKFRPQRGDHD